MLGRPDGLTGPALGWWAGRVAGFVDFVGRERELSGLLRVLGGDTRLLLVVGDAGVGKTRLVAEGMRRAAGGGLLSAWGGCLPLAERLPLLPVAEVLGELARLKGGRLLEAALGEAPPYVRAEVERLLPQLGSSAPGTGGRAEGQRERLFTAVAELLGSVARQSGLALVVEDVHWADSATLDCLTFLTRAGRCGEVTAVVTCRSDAAPLNAQVAEWLTHARGDGEVEEMRLDPLSADEAAEQVAELVGKPPPVGFADELYARAEGNPFFTEQLVAAAQSGPAEGGLSAAGRAADPAG